MVERTTPQSMAGTAVAITTTLPETYDAAGYGVIVDYAPIGEVEMLGPHGISATVTEFVPSDTGVVTKVRGAKNYGRLDLTAAYLPSDAGQDIAEAAAELNTRHSVRITYPDAAIHYLDVLVSKDEGANGASNDSHKRAFELAICRKPSISDGLFEAVYSVSRLRDGAWNSASDIATLFQTSTGTTPVTAITNPVGLWLDKRLGLVLGPEFIADPSFDDAAKWTLTQPTSGVVSVSGGVLTITSSDGSTANAKQNPDVPLEVGKAYKYTVVVDSASGFGAYLYGGSGTGSTTPSFTAAGTYTGIIVATATTLLISRFGGGASSCVISNISIKLLDGNHLLQATAAARPTWNVDAGGHYYLDFAGTDDSLSSATGGGGSAGFFFCAAIEVTGGAGTLRTIWSDNGTNTGYKVQLDANNKLSFSAGNGVAFTTLASTATLTTKSLITVKDDGENLSVQIGSAAEETVARPVVSAGTAGYTVGKDNGAATSFAIMHLYEPIYWKDTAGTASERANVQALVMSKAGL